MAATLHKDMDVFVSLAVESLSVIGAFYKSIVWWLARG